MKTNKQIQKESSLGLSEDINGQFYTIYDFDKIVNSIIENACEALYGLSNELGCDIPNMEKAQSYLRKALKQ